MQLVSLCHLPHSPDPKSKTVIITQLTNHLRARATFSLPSRTCLTDVSSTLINVDCNFCVSTTSVAIWCSLETNSSSSFSRNFRSVSSCEINSSELPSAACSSSVKNFAGDWSARPALYTQARRRSCARKQVTRVESLTSCVDGKS